MIVGGPPQRTRPPRKFSFHSKWASRRWSKPVADGEVSEEFRGEKAVEWVAHFLLIFPITPGWSVFKLSRLLLLRILSSRGREAKGFAVMQNAVDFRDWIIDYC